MALTRVRACAGAALAAAAAAVVVLMSSTGAAASTAGQEPVDTGPVACLTRNQQVAADALRRVEDAVASPAGVRRLVADLRTAPEVTLDRLLGDELDPSDDPERSEALNAVLDRLEALESDGAPGWEALATDQVRHLAVSQVASWWWLQMTVALADMPEGHPCKAEFDEVETLMGQSIAAQRDYDNCLENPPPPPPPTGGGLPGSVLSEDDPTPGQPTDEDVARCESLWLEVTRIDGLLISAMDRLQRCMDANSRVGSSGTRREGVMG